MFERFSDRARRVVVLAQEEARRLRQPAIGPEHILLSLLRVDGVAAQALASLNVSPEAVRRQVEEHLGTGDTPSPEGHIPFQRGAKRVLELALREALRLGHNYIGTEHILLGLLRQAEGEEDSAVRFLGVDAQQVRTRIRELLPSTAGQGSTWSPALTVAGSQARKAAGDEPVATGHLLLAMLADPECQAAQALAALGVSAEAAAGQLERIPVTGTSDAPPVPRSVEIKLGDQTTTIDDPDVAAALGGLSPEELRAALQRAFGPKAGSKAGSKSSPKSSPKSKRRSGTD
jgi:ATP-dependent Clp protease ATP-binding subunit ClpA